MHLHKNEYTLSRHLVRQILTALEGGWFTMVGEEEHNNDDVISAQLALEEELKRQEDA